MNEFVISANKRLINIGLLRFIRDKEGKRLYFAEFIRVNKTGKKVQEGWGYSCWRKWK